MNWLRYMAMTMLLVLCAPAFAQGAGDAPHVAMRLIAESERPAAGADVVLALESVPQPEWHGYFRNPGDAGVETRAAWTLPAGVVAGPLQYPVPTRLRVAGIMNYVYAGPYAHLVRLRLPAGLATGTPLPIRVAVDYLVCTEEICVPERATLATELRVGDGMATGERRAMFDRWRAAMPRPLGGTARFERTGDALRIAIPYPADARIGDAYFFPLTTRAIDHGAEQRIARDGDRIVIATKAVDTPGRIEGVLATGDGRGLAIVAVPGSVPPLSSGAPVWATLIAFGGALLGGLILNVMPCVFPILSLKALGLARAGGSEARARSEALAYTAGVVLVCAALGGVLLTLRAAGTSVGWAFQLTDPRVILLLLLLVTGIAFNLAGLFELAGPRFAARSGAGGAFATGALAAFVATPCTGPFMGAAMGAALVLPPVSAMLVFVGLGIGLALPFLLLGFVPALRRRLPRPGPWMDRLRKALSVPMFLTALALAWILGKQAGIDGMTLGLGAALVAALGLWWTGHRQGAGRDRAWVPGAVAAMLALATLPFVTRAPSGATGVAASGAAAPFSEARLAALRQEGRPVFAYFTADWCLTCKVNEKGAIETDAVAAAFSESGVEMLVGDWTDGDPALGRFLEAHGRAGVPLYLWYAPGAAEPRVLPQILTPQTLTALAAGVGTREGAGPGRSPL